MARDIEDIYDSLVELIGSRSGSSWSSLKDSLVGKELLWAGANIVSATELLSDSVNGVLDLSRYDLRQLLSYAYTNEVPVDLSRPASVKISFSGFSSRSPQTFAPFSLCLRVGNSSFYNIGYCDTSGEVDLYQGVPQYVVSGSDFRSSLPFPASDLTDGGPWRLYLELREGRYQSSYVKLGSDVLSSSVWVFARSIGTSGSDYGPVFPYTSYNASLSNPSAKLYKVRSLWDESCVVLFGDSNWAQPVLPSQYDYCIVWLRGTYTRFTVTSGLSLEVTGASSVSSLKQLSRSESGVGFRIVSSVDGESPSLSYARNYVISSIFRDSGLVTETQIRNFVLSFPSVQSTYLSVSPQSVDVYVKPVTEGDTAFGFIADYLYQYGVSGIRYSVSVATALPFIISLRASTSDSSSSLIQAQNYLRQLYSYANVTLSTRVSSALVQQELTLQGLNGIVATLYARESVPDDTGGSFTLQSLPAVGSIVLRDRSGLPLGFDSDGRFKEYVELSSTLASSLNSEGVMVSGVGDYVWLGGNNVSYLVSLLDGRLLLSDSSVSFAADSAQFAPYSDGLLALWSGSDKDVSFRLYRDSSIFHAGRYSLFERPSYITPVSSSDPSGLFRLKSYETVSVYSILGVSGSGSDSDFLIASISYKLSVGSSPVQYGLARYRRSGSEYYLDLTMMLANTTSSFASASSYYDGVWYMPLSSDSTGSLSGFLVHNESSPGLGITNEAGVSVWSKSLDLELISGSDSVGSLLGVNVLSMHVVSPTYMVMLYERDSKRYLGLVYFVISSDTVSKFRYSISKEEPFDVPYADSIVSVSGTSLTLVGTPSGGGSSLSSYVFWHGSYTSIGNGFLSSYRVLKASTAGSYVLTNAGSVDYSTGIIYGLGGSSGSYVEYEVGSTLSGGSTYPLLSSVVVES